MFGVYTFCWKAEWGLFSLGRFRIAPAAVFSLLSLILSWRAMSSVLNVNVGVLGHVDSGKTSLARALSTLLSTASLDKHPQSQERGITLDLGFSAMRRPLPSHLADSSSYGELQFTLVDCPGHASLIRTIMGGAQIVDVMILVVDVTKGMQTQTAECLVVGEILAPSLVVVLNKCDLLGEEGSPAREEKLAKMKKRLAKTFEATRFAGCTMVPISARPGGAEDTTAPSGLDALVEALEAHVPADLARRRSTLAEGSGSSADPLLMAVDHAFPIKGKGTVLTGTVLQGVVSVNDMIELPVLKETKKVKSMQMFHQPVNRAVQGDRLGMLVTQLDAKAIERGIVASPGAVPTFTAAVCALEKIRFFKGRIATKSRFHVTIGHETSMAELLIFGLGSQTSKADARERVLAAKEKRRGVVDVAEEMFDIGNSYLYQEELMGAAEVAAAMAEQDNAAAGSKPGDVVVPPQYALLTFDQPVTAPEKSLLIGARLDADIHQNSCRLAFHGKLIDLVYATGPGDAGSSSGAASACSKFRIYKNKERNGVVERWTNEYEAVCKGMFKKETDMTLFQNMEVKTGTGIVGVIAGTFGKSGKFKVSFRTAVPKEEQSKPDSNRLTMSFRKYVFDSDKHAMRQESDN